MSPRRLALLALLAAALAPAPARAALPVAIYPVRVPGLTPAQRGDLHGLLEAGLVSAGRRGILEPRSPIVLSPTCGDSPTPACLGAAARGGLLLVGRGELRGGIILLTAALYDRNGARSREVRFVVDLVIQNLRPVGEALLELEVEIEPDGTITGSGRSASPAARDPHGPKPVAAAPPPAPAAPPPLPPREAATPAAVPAPAAAPPASPASPAKVASAAPAVREPAAARAPLDVSAPATRALWKRQAGPLFTILGGALLAGGATVAVLNQSLADDLAAKRAAGKLVPADRASFDRVDRYNVLSTALFAAGGVSAAAGTWIWITAPARPGDAAVAMVGGRF